MAEIKVKLKTPLVPNFICDENLNPIHISNIDVATLTKIGKEWTAALIKKSKIKVQL